MSTHEVLSKTWRHAATHGNHVVGSPVDGAELGRVAFDDAKSIRCEDRARA